MARVIFPDIIQGMYTPEELNPDLIVDEDGNVIGGTIDMTASASRKAGDTYLKSEQGQNKLKSFLFAQGLNSSELYTKLLQRLGVSGFSEITLSEEELYTRIREFAAEVKAQAPAPARETSEPAAEAGPETEKKGWSDSQTIERLLTSVRKGTVENLSIVEMARLAKIATPEDYDAWNATYPTGKLAQEAIRTAFEAEISAKPAPAPKTPFVWTEEAKTDFDKQLSALYNLAVFQALEFTGKAKVEDFPSLDEALEQVKKEVVTRNLRFNVTLIQRLNPQTGTGYSVFPDAPDILPVRLYDTSKELERLGEKFMPVVAQLKDKAGEILQLPATVSFEWKWGNEQKTYAVVVSESLREEIPF
jgi:hypothetical protein